MLSIVYALLIAFALVLATAVIHYEVLTTSFPIRGRVTAMNVRARMLRLLAGIFLAHLLQICLYALAYYLMNEHLRLGTLAGRLGEGAMDYFYFSIISYTSLGFGDVYPLGPMRIVGGIESLNGLVMIGWSTSYTYLAMQRFSRIARRSRADLG